MARKEISKTRVERAMAQVQMAKIFPNTHLGTDAILILTNWSTPTLYRKIRDGKFPRTIAPGKWNGGQVFEHLA